MFNQDQMGRIASKLGYQGPMHKFNEFLASNPGAQRAYAGLENKAKMMKMAKGGAVKTVNPTNGGTFDVAPGGRPTYKPGDPNTISYNYTGGFSGLEGGEPTTVPLGLYESPAPGRTQGIYNMMMPNQGYKFGYDDQGFRYTVPEDYDFSAATTPKPGVTTGPELNFEASVPNKYAPYGEYSLTGKPGPDYPDPYGLSEADRQRLNSQYAASIGPKPGVQTGLKPGGQPLVNDSMPYAVYNPLQDARTDQDFYATGTPEYNAQLAQQNAQRAATTQQPIMQTSEGVGAPTVGAAVPQMTPFGPKLDAEGNPVQQQVLDVDGNPVTDADGNLVYETQFPTIPEYSATQMFQPGLPPGAQMLSQGVEFGTQQAVSPAGTQVGTAPTVAQPSTATTAQAEAPITPTAQQYQAMLVSGQVPATAPAVGTVSAPMQAQTTVPTSTEVANQQAAQIDQAMRVQAPDARQLSAEELVAAPADAQFAAQFAEEVQAAQGQPSEEATVRGQLTNLMAEFEDGQTPPWAAGAMRNATAILAQRGLGASSLAGQAIIQAAMESALPIAQADAQTMAQFDMQNLSNRQQRAMLAAQQRAQFIGQEFDQEFQARVTNAARISDIANINFNAEQQIALENARMAQTVDLSNLSNRQAVQMANIAQIAQLEMTNLNNRQQAAVQNAQSFLQMDMANLSNDQQAVMFDAQSKVQALLSDQSATNAARQFNASSQNQVDQFFANLSTQVSQFNATQSNAMEQFNIEQESTINRFNSELKNQRDQFNAQNQLVIAQSNAQWRREIATINTASINEANAFNAQAVLGVSEQAYANLWQAYEDEMEYAWQGGQNELDRINKLAQQRILADSQLAAADATRDAASSSALGSFAATALFGVPGASAFKGFLS